MSTTRAARRVMRIVCGGGSSSSSSSSSSSYISIYSSVGNSSTPSFTRPLSMVAARPPPLRNGRTPAEYHELRERQLRQETKTIDETCAKYKTLVDTMVKMGRSANLPPGHELLVDWYVPLVEAIDAEQRAVVDDVKFMDRQLYGERFIPTGANQKEQWPFLASTSPDKLAVITIHTAINSCTASGDRGASFARLAKDIADAVQAQVNFAGLQDKLGKGIASRLTHAGTLSMRRINQRARASLESTEWEPHIKAKLGAVLISMLLKVAVLQNGETPCFRHKITQLKGNHKQGTIVMEPSVSEMLKSQATARSFVNTNVTIRSAAPAADKGGQDGQDGPPLLLGEASLEGLTGTVTAWDKEAGQHWVEVADGSRHLVAEAHLERTDAAPVVLDTIGMPLMARNLPMLVAPRPWTRFDKGGFLKQRSKVMRIRGSRGQTDALRHAPLERVFEGLNALGKLEWRVNTEVLDVLQQAWNEKKAIGELPSQTDHLVPELPSQEDKAADEKAYWQALYRLKKVKAKNSDLHSLRCDAQIKLGIAQSFRDDTFFFPYNMDFRGRAYPIPPNLNHLGNDMSRGLLTFAEKKPLGPRGLFWLKVQVSNLCGFDKASFEDRAAWTDARMDQVRDSAAQPLDGAQWWLEAENPWQALATCMELVRAVDSPDPEAFLSGMPVHMDGSCNGLQHYAALGRDFEGGKQVNLVDGEKPRDVYSGVCAIVVAKVAQEAARTPGPGDTENQLRENASAKLIEGMIDRKVVKQTVMTSVYGVTFIGARRQIQSRLEEKLAASGKLSDEEVEKLAYGAASYVATITMDALTELFTGARNTMAWLAACARVVAAKGQPVNWVTPLGLPVSQPYRHGGLVTVKTVLQTVQVVHESDDLNVHVVKQKNAFPPNFVHSLDSTHMLLTSIRMQSRGLSFTAVHDSYWTHPSSVDVMNHELRVCFKDLYSTPILENLLESFELRYPTCQFPPVPERGALDLEDVTKSTYFFN